VVSVAAMSARAADHYPMPTEDLAERVAGFELRFYRGLLAARVALPTAILFVLLAEAVERDVSWQSLIAWGALSGWTGATLVPLWNRLAWARLFPLVARLETSVLVALVVFGVGTRPWHLLHSFVTLVFVAVFVSRRATIVVGLALIGALWSVYVLRSVWPAAPVDPRLAAFMPTAIVCAAAAVMLYLRSVLTRIGRIIDAQRSAEQAVEIDRRALLAQTLRADVFRSLARELEPFARMLTRQQETLETRSSLDENERALVMCLAASVEAIDDLGGLDDQDATHRMPVSLSRELSRAAERSDLIGGTVAIVADGTELELSLSPPELAGFRRLVGEAIVNARKHGSGEVEVRVRRGHDGHELVVTNPVGLPRKLRTTGGSGLAAMRADAKLLGVSYRWTQLDGTAISVIGLPRRGADTRIDAEDDQRDEAGHLRRELAHSVFAYERLVLTIRLGLAAITFVTIRLAPGEHHSLLPALTITAALYIGWNLVLVVQQQRFDVALARRPVLVWVDAGLVGGMILFESGMASPWFPISMATVMFVSVRNGFRAGCIAVGAFGAAMLGGYELVHLLALDDAGTRAQRMPFDWFLNLFIYLSIAATGSSVSWLFGRLGEATAEYARTIAVRQLVDRELAAARARDEAHRELHASLQQYIHAAMVRLDLVESTDEAGGLNELETSLVAVRDALADLLVRLRPAAAAH
jgi:signal transduction histidine kinase